MGKVKSQENNSGIESNCKKKIHNPPTTFSLAHQIDYLDSDFSDFEGILGRDNVQAINVPNGTLNFQPQINYRKFFFGTSIGFMRGGGHQTDSIDIKYRETQFGIYFGYNLIRLERLTFSPTTSLKIQKSRLINTDKVDKIPLEKYLNNRDLDLRIKQLYCLIGLSCSYDIYPQFSHEKYEWSIGFYAYYTSNLNLQPIINSRRNRLTSHREIHSNNYNLGIFVRVGINKLGTTTAINHAGNVGN